MENRRGHAPTTAVINRAAKQREAPRTPTSGVVPSETVFLPVQVESHVLLHALQRKVQQHRVGGFVLIIY